MISDRLKYIERDFLLSSTKNMVEPDYPRPLLTPAKFRRSSVPRVSSSRINMAPTALVSTLPVTVLVAISVIRGPPDTNNTNLSETSSSDILKTIEFSIAAGGDVEVTNPTRTPAFTSSTLPEGYVTFSDLHSAYKVYKTNVTWAQARRQCIAEGADLAIADTVQKIGRIYTMQSVVHNWISVGIRKSYTTEDWVRVDNGLPLASIPWFRNNPDDAGDCAFIIFGGMALANMPCDRADWWYVCEIKI